MFCTQKHITVDIFSIFYSKKSKSSDSTAGSAFGLVAPKMHASLAKSHRATAIITICLFVLMKCCFSLGASPPK